MLFAKNINGSFNIIDVVLIVVVLPNTVKLPCIIASCVTVNEPVIVPPDLGKALFAVVNAELAYELAAAALDVAELACKKAALACEKDALAERNAALAYPPVASLNIAVFATENAALA